MATRKVSSVAEIVGEAFDTPAPKVRTISDVLEDIHNRGCHVTVTVISATPSLQTRFVLSTSPTKTNHKLSTICSVSLRTDEYCCGQAEFRGFQQYYPSPQARGYFMGVPSGERYAEPSSEQQSSTPFFWELLRHIPVEMGARPHYIATLAAHQKNIRLSLLSAGWEVYRQWKGAHNSPVYTMGAMTLGLPASKNFFPLKHEWHHNKWFSSYDPYYSPGTGPWQSRDISKLASE